MGNRPILTASFLALVTSAASAGDLTYSSRAVFEAAPGGGIPLVEGFEGYQNGQALGPLFAGQGIFATPTPPSAFAGSWGACAVQGKAALPEPRGQGLPLVVLFSTPVFAVGADLFDDGAQADVLALEAITTSGTVLSVEEASGSPACVGFLGASSDDGIVRARFHMAGSGKNFEADHLTIRRFGTAGAGPGYEEEPPLLKADLYPSSGPEGTSVRLRRSLSPYLATYQPEDVLLLGTGQGGFFGRVQHLSSSRAVGRVGFLAPFPAPQAVHLWFGAGADLTVAPLGGVSWGAPAYSWSAPKQHPDVASVTPFRGDGLDPFQACFQDPEPRARAPFRIGAGGVVRLAPPGPGTCDGDRFAGWLQFDTALERVAVHVPPSGSLPEEPWATANAFLLHPLNVALATVGAAATWDPAAQEVVVTSSVGPVLAVHPESRLRFDFDPDRHPVFTQQRGSIDEFAPPLDPAQPRPQWRLFAEQQYNAASRDYDEVAIDDGLTETYDAFGTGSGPVRAANWETRIHGDGAQTETDRFEIGWDSTSQLVDWRIDFVDLAQLSFRWRPGDLTSICFDLDALPNEDFSTTSVLHRLQEDLLDVLIYDDTSVDYSILRVRRCSHP